MKYYLIPIALVFALSGCANTGEYHKFDGEGSLVESHYWKAKGSQESNVHETFSINTKQKSILEDVIKIQDAKLIP